MERLQPIASSTQAASGRPLGTACMLPPSLTLDPSIWKYIGRLPTEQALLRWLELAHQRRGTGPKCNSHFRPTSALVIPPLQKFINRLLDPIRWQFQTVKTVKERLRSLLHILKGRR